MWEFQLSLGYETGATEVCPPHYQFNQAKTTGEGASKEQYDLGSLTQEGVVLKDGTIRALACVGASAVREGNGGVISGVSLKLSKLLITAD